MDTPQIFPLQTEVLLGDGNGKMDLRPNEPSDTTRDVEEKAKSVTLQSLGCAAESFCGFFISYCNSPIEFPETAVVIIVRQT